MKRFVLVATALGAGVAVYRRVIRPWWWSWGADARDLARALPGDDLVPTPTAADTRSIEIEAPPADVWPWLMQMGYGRAGWYSYDAIDAAAPSSHRLMPAWATLEVGDIVPTHPGGGFEVRLADPDHALVLYSDTALVDSQRVAARGTDTGPAAANVRATGALLGSTQPTDFAASWTFVLEPVTDDRTRLVERFRVWFGESDKPWTALTLPVIGFGVFLMTRKQMLGIRDRAEALARGRSASHDPGRNGSTTTPLVATKPLATMTPV